MIIRGILNALGAAYILKADYDKALELNFESLLLREKEGDKAEMSVALQNIGLVYFKLRNYEQAIEYYSNALNLKKSSKPSVDLDMLLINLGLCYNQISEFAKVREFIIEGLNVCQNDCRDDILIQGKYGLGVSFFIQKKYDEAEANFQESYRLATSTNDQRFQIENLVYLGELYNRLGNLKRLKIISFALRKWRAR